jgi:hypothetical protein
MAELEGMLGSTARWHQEAAVAAMTVEMWEHLQALGEWDGGIVEAAFTSSSKRVGSPFCPRPTNGCCMERKALINNSTFAADVDGGSQLQLCKASVTLRQLMLITVDGRESSGHTCGFRLEARKLLETCLWLPYASTRRDSYKNPPGKTRI